MPRKLKTFTTSSGFFDLAIAVPSMKAALEAWGSSRNLFQQGFAQECDDAAIIAATMAKPGVVLRRAVGKKGAFREDAELPKSLPMNAPPVRQPRAKSIPSGKATAAPRGRDADTQKAAVIQFDKEKARREKVSVKDEERRQKEVVAEAREEQRRRLATGKVEAARDRARERHEERIAQFEAERDVIDRRIEVERDRWSREEKRLDGKIRDAGR